MRNRLQASLAILAVALWLHTSRVQSAEPVYPGKTWTTKTPAEVGVDAKKLKAFRSFVGGRGCVVRQGTMVYWSMRSMRQIDGTDQSDRS